jgi:hypothetical protein
MHRMDFIIKASSDGTSGCLTSTEFPRKKFIHLILGKKIKVCEVMTFDVIMIDTKLIATTNVINPMDRRNSHLFGKVQFLLIISICICYILIIVTI